MLWPYGHQLCRLHAAFRYFNAFADWMSLGVVAFARYKNNTTLIKDLNSIFRCLSLTKPDLCHWLFGGQGSLFLIALIWFYSLLLVTPSLSGLYGEFGWNAR